MSVAGKKKEDWVAQTFCDFNQNRREVLRNHFSMDSALRSWDNFANIYKSWGRCWQETKDGEVFNDSDHIG